MLNRRHFFYSSAAAAAGLSFSALTTLTPESVHAASEELACHLPTALPDPALYTTDESAYWAAMRTLFVIPADTAYLNNGTVGSSPTPVLQAVFDSYFECERLSQTDPEDYPIWGYGPFNKYRDPLAAFIGCTRDELAITRNATESNSYIANGLDFKSGDEVLMTDQEHPGGEHPFNVRAKRAGIVVKKIKLNLPVKNAAEVLNAFNDAVTPRTKLIFFSHITTVTGVVLPAKEICALARSKGILSAVDGAHVTGMLKLNVHDIGCDFYTSSPHKWLQAPKGSGYLYIRDEVIDRLWNTIVTEGWDEPQRRAGRFQQIGSSNVPVIAGMKAAVEMATAIGMDRIEKRHRTMADYLLTQLQNRGVESWTSPDPALRGGIITVNATPIIRTEIEAWLWKEKKIRIRGGIPPSKLRLSTPYYVQKADLDRFLAAFDEYRKLKHL